ncbi:hypothetical protein U3516DRAFT_609427 [Neocallimastix sp. 'constans']
MLQITCLLWGDDPSQGFMINLSPKDTIYNLKQKIVEYLELGNNISRKIKLIKLKEFITLDDKRLKQYIDPKELFTCDDLDKPFQILDDYFTEKDENLKEFPLDIIVLLNNDNSIPNAILDEKEKEDVVMAPHKPVNHIIRESALVSNNSSFLTNKKAVIDPSSFPSPPSFDDNLKGRDSIKNNSSQSDLSNININNIVPRSKSIIFNIDRFPSPPDDIENINNNNGQSNTHDKGKYTVCDIDQFPEVPTNEDFSITSKIPLTYNEEAPPSYDVISNRNIPLNNTISPNNNIYNNSSNINSPTFGESNQLEYEKYKNKSKILRRSLIISTCLCLGVVITTILAIVVGKSLLQKREPIQKGKVQVIKIGNITTYTNRFNQPSTSINIVTTTVRNVPTYSFNNFKTFENHEKKTLDSFVSVKSESFDNSNESVLSWRMDMSENNPMTSISIEGISDKTLKEKRNYYYNYKRDNLNEYIKDNNKGYFNFDNNEMDQQVQSKSYNELHNYDNNDDNNYFSKLINYFDSNNKYNGKYNTFYGRSEENNKNDMNKPRENKNEDKQYDKVEIDNDLTLNLDLKLKRIVEISDNITRSESLNYLEFTKENLSQSEKSVNVVNNSKNTQSGLIEVRKVYENQNLGKRVIVMNKMYSGDHKDENNLEMNPSILRWYINIMEWNVVYQHSRLQIECEINSSKLFWSDVNTQTIYFDKGQGIINFGDTVNYIDRLKLESDKDIISRPTNGKPIPLVFDIVVDIERFKDNKDKSLNGNTNKKFVSFSIIADMNMYNALNILISSSGSSFKVLKSSNYYLWFFTTFILIIIYYFDII